MSVIVPAYARCAIGSGKESYPPFVWVPAGAIRRGAPPADRKLHCFDDYDAGAFVSTISSPRQKAGFTQKTTSSGFRPADNARNFFISEFTLWM